MNPRRKVVSIASDSHFADYAEYPAPQPKRKFDFWWIPPAICVVLGLVAIAWMIKEWMV